MTNLKLKLRRSKYLTGLLLLMHLGAIGCVLSLNFSIWLISLLIILISYSCYTGLRPKDEVLALGECHAAFIAQYLIILVNKTKRSVVICSDSTDKETLRTLRVLLRN